MIYILDKQQEICAVLANENPGACPYYDDKLTQVLSDGSALLEFKIPADHASAKLAAVEGYALKSDLDGAFLLFKIRKIEKEGNGENQQLLSIYCESAALDLLYDVVRPQNLGSITTSAALDKVLFGTDWQRGEVDWTGFHKFNFTEYMTVLEAVQSIKTTTGGDIRFRVTLAGSKISGRYVDIVQQVGSDAGMRFEYGKDLTQVIRRESTEDLVTALIGIGQGNTEGQVMTFTDVEWSVAKGNPVDKPKGQDWIGDPEALQAWGRGGRHLMGIFTSESETSDRMLAETWEALQNRNKPKLEYEMDAVLLEKVSGYAADRKRLGDTITIIDRSFDPPLYVKARITQLETCDTDPTQDRVTLANFVEFAIKDYDAMLAKLSSTIHAKEQMWTAAEHITKAPAPPQNPSDGQLWLDTTNPALNVIKKYDASSGSWVKATPTKPFEVGAEKEIPKQADPPPAPAPGDVWINTSDPGNPAAIMQWNEAAQAWEKLTRTSLDEMSGQITPEQIGESVIKESNIDAGAVSEAKMRWATHLLF